MNRKPFRLAGFGWDYGGTVLSWADGDLEPATARPCRLAVRLSPDVQDWRQDKDIWDPVQGDRDFSSGHPSMQALDPAAYDMLLLYEALPTPAPGQ